MKLLNKSPIHRSAAGLKKYLFTSPWAKKMYIRKEVTVDPKT
jgi:hypothetical protein